jgi:hypothetical protein
VVQGQPRQKVGEPSSQSINLVAVVITCHLSYGRIPKKGDWGLEWPGQTVRPYLQNNQSKKNWRCCLRGRGLAWQAQSPDFKLSILPSTLNSPPPRLPVKVQMEIK